MPADESVNREAAWEALGIPVYGTVTTPASAACRGGVVLVAGSGPTDRDWCSPLLPGTNGSGRLLAEALARRGYGTLRYDKLASGPHVRENAPRFAGRLSMQSHVEELAGAVRTLAAESHVPPDRTFALTNSEGAIHAVNYQLRGSRPRFRGLVLTGCPGISIGADARRQIAEQGRALPNREELLRLYDEAITRFLAGSPATPDTALPEAVRQVFRGLENPLNLPFSRELWGYALADHLAGVVEPVLVLIGKKDVQIDWREDGGALARAVGGRPNVSFDFPANANHVLKHETTPRDQLDAATVGLRYNAPDAALDGEAVQTILDWLERQPGAASP
jgi:uncharacterized protein